MKKFLRETIRNNKILFNKICEFNFSPLSYINEGRLRKFLHDFGLENVNIDDRWLSKIILNKLGLSKDYFFDFEPIFRRVVLLKGKEILKLLNLCGAVLHRDRISHIIEKKRRLEFENIFGRDVYIFAIKRAPLLIKDRIIPQELLPNTERIENDIKESGLWCMKICFFDEPKAFIARLELKLPLQFSLNRDTKGIEFKDKIQSLIYKIIKSEIREQWLFSI